MVAEGLVDLLARQIIRSNETLVGGEERVERGARDTEQVGGRGATPPGLLQGIDDLVLGQILRPLAMAARQGGYRPPGRGALALPMAMAGALRRSRAVWVSQRRLNLGAHRELSLAAAEHNELPHDVAELAHVARPRRAREPRDDRRGEPGPLGGLPVKEARLLVGVEQLAEKVHNQSADVVAARAERRDPDRELSKPVQKRLAEAPRSDGGLDVGVGGGEQTHVDLAGPSIAHALHLVRLDRPEQHRLHGGVSVADLVEEERPSGCRFDVPLVIGDRAAERAADVPEERARCQRWLHCPHVDGHVGPRRARASRVNRPRDELLAAAGLAADQHAQLCRPCAHRIAAEPIQGVAVAYKTEARRPSALRSLDVVKQHDRAAAKLDDHALRELVRLDPPLLREVDPADAHHRVGALPLHAHLPVSLREGHERVAAQEGIRERTRSASRRRMEGRRDAGDKDGLTGQEPEQRGPLPDAARPCVAEHRQRGHVLGRGGDGARRSFARAGIELIARSGWRWRRALRHGLQRTGARGPLRRPSNGPLVRASFAGEEGRGNVAARMGAGRWLAGRILADRYQLKELIGSGGMGVVWSAEHTRLRSPVAVKLLHDSIAEQANSGPRFLREAQACAAIRGPNVVQVLDFGVEEGTPYIAMELLSGETLRERLRRETKLTPAATLDVVSQMARAIGRAHKLGIVHRDLKPSNIQLCADEEEIVKVLDFGIAKLIDGMPLDERLTITGEVLGTAAYMSPEQARGRMGLDYRADLWSLAIITYECLVGALPLRGRTPADLIVAICTEPMPRPSAVAPGLPAAFDAWFARGTRRVPDERFESAGEMAEALRDAIHSMIVRA